MLLIITAIYAVILFLLRRLPQVEQTEWWSRPVIFPHAAIVQRSSITVLSISVWILLTTLVLASSAFVESSQTVTAIQGVFGCGQGFLVILGILTVIESCQTGVKNSTKPTAVLDMVELARKFPYAILAGTPIDILSLHANPRLDPVLAETPYDNTRIVPSNVLPEVLAMCPSLSFLPWDESFQERLLEVHARALDLRDAKVTAAMNSEAESQALQDDVASLKSRLATALDSARNLDRSLHEIRSKGSSSIVDYSKMTPSQRIEEEKRLSEAMRRLAQANNTTFDQSEAIRTPSDGFHTEIKLGSSD